VKARRLRTNWFTTSRATVLVSSVIFFLCAGTAAALSVQARLAETSSGITVSVYPDDPPLSEVIDSLGNGMQAEVTFIIQVYREPTGLIRLFGDRLVQEVRITRDARWDVYSQQYLVSGTDRPIVRSQTVTDFTRSFFDLNSFSLPWSFLGKHANAGEVRPSYLMVRVLVRPMKLVSALAIMSILRLEPEVTSHWFKLELPPQSESGN